jgi:hypothetical protein
MKTIIFFGIIRSGNHGLINAILDGYKNPIHINNVVLNYETYKKHSQIQIDKKRSDINYIGFKGCDCVILSIENISIDNKQIDLFLKNVDDVKISVLIRNPYNCISSVYKCHKNEAFVRYVVKQWVEYCNIVLHPPAHIHPLIYDKVFTDNGNYNEFMTHVGIRDVSDEVKTSYTKWGYSSWDIKTDIRRMMGSLDDCLYANNEFIRSIFESNPHVGELWKKVHRKYIDAMPPLLVDTG